ncbi:hypothetical protein NKDENANG_02435 [Candidatus Entotheonellaceae bacterium PAL068K]
MISMRQNFWKLLVTLVCLGFPLAGVQAQSDEGVIQYRQKVMQSNSANLGAIGHILKYKLPHQSHIVTHARELMMTSMLVGEAFKKEVTAGRTDSKPEIWKDWAKFEEAAKAGEQESAKLVEVAQSGDMAAISAQMKKLLKSCSGCHKPFRKPKKESYKQLAK